MPAHDDLIAKIIAESKLPGRARQEDLRRELRAHLEDLCEEARAAGYEDTEIEQIALRRFGNPAEIADQLGQAYRFDRVAGWLFPAILLALFCFAAVAALVLTVQGAAALAMTGSLAHAFPQLDRELWGFAFVSAGYLAAHRAVCFFRQGHRWRGVTWAAGWLVVLATVLAVFMGGHRITLLAAFVGATTFRLLRITRIRLLWLAGIAVPISLAWLLSGPLIYFHGVAAPWYLAALVCADLAVSCRILEAFTGIFDRYLATA